MAADIPKLQRLANVGRAFTPSAPINKLDLLAGRMDQIRDVVSATSQPGYHVALYGERGVGKTSLANVLAEFFKLPELQEPHRVAMTNCNTDSTFPSLWRIIGRELGIEFVDDATPEDVRFELARIEEPTIIVIDELDRMEDDDALTLLADTVKTLSDHSVPTTLVLVGVASSLRELVGEHASIVRNLAQVEMPRMTQRELKEICAKGSDRSGLPFAADAVQRIVALSEGLPHYTHLLAFHAGSRTVQDDRHEVRLADVEASLPDAVARHTIRSDYIKATRSARADALYPHVLLACALAPKSQLGEFTAGAIREPLEIIAHRRIEIPAFARHLTQFLEQERGCILHRDGSPKRYFYRFSDPLVVPYIVMHALAEGFITTDDLSKIRGGASSFDVEPSVPPRLF